MGEVKTCQVNGVPLACEARGPAEGPPVVLPHALGEDRTSWASVTDAPAADGRRTYAVGLRGHGGSVRPSDHAAVVAEPALPDVS